MKMNKITMRVFLIAVLAAVASACTPTSSVMLVEPALEEYYGRECALENVFENKPICPEHVVMVREPELFCQNTLGGVECYASDPREIRLATDNAHSPLVADEVEIFNPDIPDPRAVANGRDRVDDINVMSFPPRYINQPVRPQNSAPPVNQTR